MVQSGKSNVPRSSAGTENPCVTTVPIITNILNNANVLAFASCGKIISYILVAPSSSVSYEKFRVCTNLRNIPIQTQRPTDTPNKHHNRARPPRQPSQVSNILHAWPNGLDHRRNAIPHNHRKRHHAPKRKRPLRKANSQQSPPAKAELHRPLKRVPPRHLGVYNNQPDGPIDDHSQNDQQRHSGRQPRLFQRVRLPYYPRAQNRVRHIRDRSL